MEGLFKVDPKYPHYVELIPHKYSGNVAISATPSDDNPCWEFEVEFLNGYKRSCGSTYLSWNGQFDDIEKLLDRMFSDGEVVKL